MIKHIDYHPSLSQKKGLFFLFISLILLPFNSSVSQNSDEFLLQFVPTEPFKVETGLMYKLFPTGKIEELPFKFPKVHYGGWGSGVTSNPTPSRSNRYIGFLKDFNIWLLELTNNETTQATTIGRSSDDKYWGIVVSMSGWSFENEKLLYSVLPESGHEGEGPPLITRKVKSGWYIYDPVSKKSSFIDIPGDVLSWLPNNQILVKTPPSSQENESMGRQIQKFDIESTKLTPLLPMKGDFEFNDISKDGKWVLITSLDWDKYTTSLLKINIDNREVVSILKDIEWASIQFAHMSPQGGTVSCVTIEKSTETRPVTHGDITTWLNVEVYTLVVNGKEIYTSDQFFGSHKWIDEKSIALFNRDAVVIIESDSGKELGRRVLN
ncbi:hypothetical protein BVX98_01105 [bacterium F11]|nr:hypothetical protein BVX98_01105 [bacterium F11]